METKNPEWYLKQPYTRVLLPEAEGGFFAEILEFPGCYAQGENPTQAYQDLEEAAKSWLAAALEHGQTIPPPGSGRGYSGKLALWLPRGLHRKVAQRANQEGISMNQLLIIAISSWIGW
jgi:antitoxin HicB